MQVFPEVTATWYIFLPLDFQGNKLLISQDEYDIVWTITDEREGYSNRPSDLVEPYGG